MSFTTENFWIVLWHKVICGTMSRPIIHHLVKKELNTSNVDMIWSLERPKLVCYSFPSRIEKAEETSYRVLSCVIGWRNTHNSWEVNGALYSWHSWVPTVWKISERNHGHVIFPVISVNCQIKDLVVNRKSELIPHLQFQVGTRARQVSSESPGRGKAAHYFGLMSQQILSKCLWQIGMLSVVAGNYR